METMKNLSTRLISVFAGAAIPNVTVGTVIGVEVWKAAVMAGVVAVLAVLQKLAASMADGVLTFDEIDDAFGES